MNYDVIWSEEADTRFVWLWLRASDTERVIDAYEIVNRILADSPTDLGESRSSHGERLRFHLPFELASRIDEERREVDVIEVRWIGG